MVKNDFAYLTVALLADEFGISSSAYFILLEILSQNNMEELVKQAKAIEDRYVYMNENDVPRPDFLDDLEVSKDQVMKLARHLFDDGQGINQESYDLIHDLLVKHDDIYLLDNIQSSEGRFFVSETFFK